MKKTGHLHKLRNKLASPIQYFLPLDDDEVPLNELIGQKITLEFSGEIHCQHCAKLTKKSYSQGYCFVCMRRLPQCDMCIMKPETCHFHLGTCRDSEWGKKNCFKDHTVYLANTSGVKVGITRDIPTRWIDQGATQALAIFRVKNRLLSGLIETTFKQHIADKTDWRKMLKGNAEPVALDEHRDMLFDLNKDAIVAIIAEHGKDSVEVLDEKILELDFPVEVFPEKIKSFNFDKTPSISATLLGIKGQYLIFDTGVLNIRKFTSYLISFAY
ncbi:hypothetical protein MNBD_GAMMA22-1660 [hydrothermal vent metagenome]|uniref:DUF2797 domain-containing protein n=1 Tax=hydrothermal vent metagenome TaxID=652676 RepID=A0A3B1A538_9ZZZZ